MDLLEIMKNRRSVRRYTGEPIPEAFITKILQAGLLSPSAHNTKLWEFVVVRDKEMLKKLSEAKPMSAGMLAGADCAILVFGDETRNDVWTEDCSIAMYGMHLMADSLGVGSCWVQGHRRFCMDGRTIEDYVRELLHVPDNYRFEAFLSLGMCDNHPKAHTLDELLWDKVHRETF